MKDTVLIYHGNCPDGFMAAVIFRKAAEDPARIDFVAGVHQEDPPQVAGKDVVLVDFSYKRPVILKMAERAKSILIVDHHISAAEDLVDLPPNVKTIFDMDKSGAGLAWETFMKGKGMPAVVAYIQAQDLWRLDELANVSEVAAAIHSYDYDFELWDTWLDADQGELIGRLAEEGASIGRKHLKDVKETIAAGRHELEIAGWKVPAVNAPRSMSSLAAGILAEGQPFAASYHFSGEQVNFSLRSREGGEDVAAIAALYGGGGHRRAAGFRIPHDATGLNKALRAALAG
ncbi:hypothetical protein F4X86_02980 [Candidatus Saccharibacteria bacterium]|nr:hypothetical protein [Candidatus Saccharibacteria bacterium]